MPAESGSGIMPKPAVYALRSNASNCASRACITGYKGQFFTELSLTSACAGSHMCPWR